MELPTYTSIWRIEKRLYKLYDFRLPMPLPGGPDRCLHRRYRAVRSSADAVRASVQPQLCSGCMCCRRALLTWLATRPVLESKRLPELLISQVRYLGEPSTWCRMAPLAEKDQVMMFGRVWRRPAVAAMAEAAQAEIASAEQARPSPNAGGPRGLRCRSRPRWHGRSRHRPPPRIPSWHGGPGPAGAGPADPAAAGAGGAAPEAGAGEGSGGTVPGRAGPAGRRTAGEALGTCGGHIAPDIGT